MEYSEPLNIKWITEGIEPITIQWSEKFAEHLAQKPGELTTSQLRKFFGELKRIQAIGFNDKSKVDFIMLKAKLAYASGRAIKNGKPGKISDFAKQLSKGIDSVNAKDHFKNFTNIVESIVAYHKVYENLK